MTKRKIIGAIIGISALAMAWIFFDWKLALILVLAIWGNNIEHTAQ